jgi:glycosyltransferase involved in cell wall biosynthesis
MFLKQKRIGLRVFSNTAWMGGINYVLSWVKALHLLPKTEQPIVYLLYTNASSLVIAQEHANLVTDIRPFSEAHRLNLDLVYPATQIFEAPFDAPWAGWIPDWQCQYLPEMFDEIELARRALHYRLLATKAPFLVLSSQMAYADTVNVVGDKAVKMSKLHFPAVIDEQVWSWTSQEISDVLTHFQLPARFFLICNQFWKHKNHTIILKALARLADPSIVCVFTGEMNDPRWPEYFDQIQQYIAENHLSSSVYLLGCISRLEQLKLMSNALAIIQPSRFEGWSSVVEEAKAMDKVILLSDFPVHREQAPTGSYFFNPDCEEALAQLMAKVWYTPPETQAITSMQTLQQRQCNYVIDCARQLVKIAEQTRANYNPKIHDPKTILLDLLVQLAAQKRTPVQEQIYQRVLAGTRSMLKSEPEQLARFMIQTFEQVPEYWETIKQDILSPTMKTMPEDKLKRYWLEIGNTKSELVSKLNILDPLSKESMTFHKKDKTVEIKKIIKKILNWKPFMAAQK